MSETQDDARPFGAAGNPLEQALLEWAGGSLDDQGLLEALLNSAVCFFGQPMEDGEGGLRLLMIRGEDEAPWMPVFSDQERATPFAAEMEDSPNLVTVHAAELLLHLGDKPPTMVLNPGWEHGLVFPAEMVASLRKAVLDQQGGGAPGIITP